MSPTDMHAAIHSWTNAAGHFGLNWFVHSTLLLGVGLVIGWVVRRKGSAVESAVYRTALAATVVCPLAAWMLGQVGAGAWSIDAATALLQIAPDPSIRSSETASRETAVNTRDFVHPLATPTPDSANAARHSSVLQTPPDMSAGLPEADWLGRRVTESSDGSPQTAWRDVAAPAASAPSTPKSPTTSEVPNTDWFASAFIVIWLAVSILLLVRLASSSRQIARLRRSATHADECVTRLCRQLAAELRVREPAVRQSPLLASPCLVGVVRPLILLPENLSEERAADSADDRGDPPLRDVLIHELAHLHRRDCAWSLFGRLASCMLFFQPLLWMLIRRLHVTAEEVCDDYVVLLGGDRSAYARRLVDIAELSAAPMSAAAVAMVSRRSTLSKRVARILDTSRSLSTATGHFAVALVLVGGLAGTLLVGLLRAEPAPQASQQESPDEAEATRKPGSRSPSIAQGVEDTANDDGSEETSGTADAAASAGEDAEPAEELGGRVVGADGNPVAGAEVYWFRTRVHEIDPMAPQLVAMTDEKGNFHFTVPDVSATDEPAGWSYYERIVVKAAGHGFVVTSPAELRRKANQNDTPLGALARVLVGNGKDASVALPPAGGPIRGRIVSIDGQPIAGATVRIRWFNEEGAHGHRGRNTEDLSPEKAKWSERVDALFGVIEPEQLRHILPMATADADGRFELVDIGKNRLVQLMIEGDGIQTTEIAARNEPGEKLVIPPGRHSEERPRTVYGPELLLVVGPSKPVVGRVLDLDTGEPVAGAVVRAYQVHGERVSSSRERQQFATVTNAEGLYRITGLPVGEDNELVAFTTGDMPYVPVGHPVDTSVREPVVAQDFRLKRGVWAEGRVFDGQTGQPFTGEIKYYYFRNPALEQEIPGLNDAFLDGRYWTDANGEFRVPVLPTRGILAFRYSSRGIDNDQIDRYPRGAGAEEIEGSEDLGGGRAFPTQPFYLMPQNYHRVTEVHPKPGDAVVRVDMPLTASRPITVRVVDADKNPVTGYSVYGAVEMWGWQKKDGFEFEVVDLQPGERRKLFVFHRPRNLAGALIVDHSGKQPQQVVLGPAGSITGRLVDEAGEPIVDATVHPNYERLNNEDDTAIWANGAGLIANPTNIPVDREGRFRVDGLVPGWKYTAWASAPRKSNGQTMDIGIGSPFADVTVEPAEEKDLGDLVIQP